jgi:hypothetical protein
MAATAADSICQDLELDPIGRAPEDPEFVTPHEQVIVRRPHVFLWNQVKEEVTKRHEWVNGNGVSSQHKGTYLFTEICSFRRMSSEYDGATVDVNGSSVHDCISHVAWSSANWE